MNRATLLKLMLIPALALPFTTSQAATKMLWKEGNDYIAINSDAASINANHPYKVETQKLARILSQLKIGAKQQNSLTSIISSSSKSKDTRIFTDKEIDLLAQGISNALTKASANEAVTFSISDFRDVYFGDKRLSISGTAFIQDNALNLLFGEVHVDLHKKYIRSGEGVSNSRFASNVELANFKLPTGNVNKEASHDWKLKPFPGASLVNNRTDWLSIKLAHQYNYQQPENHAEKIKSKYLSEIQKNELTSKESAIEERLKRLENATKAVEAQKAAPTIDPNSVEARLKKVKSLYEQGVIPESVYLNKMNAIINEL
ncbi:hypothetical protein [Neptuniibacter pectenicola]|uniref:hypothetical protein n=1 Tax=Neptuniibacter pectenicola TaxID=1806669 RepID=UPI0008307547|nr:hypothetical protein [Neptuniibacter pectenicola]